MPALLGAALRRCAWTCADSGPSFPLPRTVVAALVAARRNYRAFDAPGIRRSRHFLPRLLRLSFRGAAEESLEEARKPTKHLSMVIRHAGHSIPSPFALRTALPRDDKKVRAGRRCRMTCDRMVIGLVPTTLRCVPDGMTWGRELSISDLHGSLHRYAACCGSNRSRISLPVNEFALDRLMMPWNSPGSRSVLDTSRRSSTR